MNELAHAGARVAQEPGTARREDRPCNSVSSRSTGKNKSVYCDYDPQTGQHAFGTLATTPADAHDLLAGHAGHLVVIEICPLAGWVADLCQALGVALRVVNTASEQWSWRRVKGKGELLAFYDFPAEHWQHLRTTNPIESTFATVRLRTAKTKGCGSRQACLTMVYKLCRSAEAHWRKLNGCALLREASEGVEYVDGTKKAA